MSPIDSSPAGGPPRRGGSGLGATVTNHIAAWLRQMEAAGFGVDAGSAHASHPPATSGRPAPQQARPAAAASIGALLGLAQHGARAQDAAPKQTEPHDADAAMPNTAGTRSDHSLYNPDLHVAVAAGQVLPEPTGAWRTSAAARATAEVPLLASPGAPLARGAAFASPANGGAAAEEGPCEPAEMVLADHSAGDDEQAAAKQMHVQRRADGVDVWVRDAGLRPYQISRVVGAWLSDAYANGLRPRTVTVNGNIQFSADRSAVVDGAALFGSDSPSTPSAGLVNAREKRHAS